MRLVIADDAALLREGLVGLLERQGHEVVGQAASAGELEVVVDTILGAGADLDVVLTDVRMPPTMTDDGLRSALALRERYPGLGVLVLSQYVAPAYAAQLFTPASGTGSSGGVGYLLKDRVSRVADFIGSLGIVASGGVVVDPEVAAGMLQGRRSALDELTPRELEVLELMASGLSNQQIAERLFLSAGAVAKHVAGVFAKLDLGPGEENRRVRAVLAYLTEKGV